MNPSNKWLPKPKASDPVVSNDAVAVAAAAATPPAAVTVSSLKRTAAALSNVNAAALANNASLPPITTTGLDATARSFDYFGTRRAKGPTERGSWLTG